MQKRSQRDKDYFSSYADCGIHRDMLQDGARTLAYRQAILDNSALFKDAVVLDVGCGTGILSLFAAQAGASRVYAVDASSIAHVARKIVAANKLDSVITVLHSRIEDARLDHQHVDIIISEWMGYMLFYESMLSSVIYARDKWLNPLGGRMFPCSARLYLSAFTFPNYYRNNISFWLDVYGFDMSDVLPLAKRSFLDEAQVDWLSAEQEVAQRPALVKDVDLMTTTALDVAEWKCDFELKSSIETMVHGLCAWFEVDFPAPARSDAASSSAVHDTDTKRRRVTGRHSTLSTSPWCERTHWGQTLFFFNVPVEVRQDEVMDGVMSVSEENRVTSVELSWNMKDKQLIAHGEAASSSSSSSGGGQRQGKKCYKID